MQFIKKVCSDKLMLAQMIAFGAGKLVYSFVELPRTQKQRTVVVELLLAVCFYAISIGLKLYRHKSPLILATPRILIESFLIWIVTLLILMFSFALQDKMSWNFFEKMLSMLAIVLQTLKFVLFTHNGKFITKREFMNYELTLGVNVVSLAYKCVWFLTYEDQNPDKDILLLNLTTQIALAIILMDVIQRSYSQYRKVREEEKKMAEQSGNVDKELVEETA